MIRTALYLLSGGFLAGYRTYILATLGVLTSIAHYITGDASLTTTIQSVFGILASLGLVTAAVHNTGAAVLDVAKEVEKEAIDRARGSF